MMFSTPIRDNDNYPSVNCAQKYKASWWYERCHRVLLTSRYGEYPDVPENQGIKWNLPWGTKRFAKEVTMKIRPV